MLNEKKFRAIYENFLASGLSTRDFCINHQMNEAKFYYWQNKLKGQLPPKRGFVPVVFEKGQESSHIPVRREPFANQTALNQTLSCEISYPNGVRVKLNGLNDIETLRSLLLLTPQRDV